MKSKAWIQIALIIGTALILIISPLFTACAKKGEEAIIPSTTKVLDASTIQRLSSVSADGSILTFSETTAQLESLSMGDVIVSVVSDITPHGFLRKVLAVSKVNNQVVVETTEASLVDAIERGGFKVSKTLTPEDVSSAAALREGVSLDYGSGGNSKTANSLTKARGGMPLSDVSFAIVERKGVSLESELLSSPAPGSFQVRIEDVTLYDEDGDLKTTDDQIKANGEILFDPSFVFEIEIEDFGVKRLLFTVSATETAQLELVAEASILQIKQSVEIARYYLQPITVLIPLPPPLIPFPVVITPVLTLNVGLDGKVSAGIESSVTQEATVTAGVSYKDGEFSPIRKLENKFNFAPPLPQAGTSAKAFAGPRLNLLLYGMGGPNTQINGYLRLDADLFKEPWWVLYGGLEAKVEIIKIGNLIFDATVIEDEKPLAQAETPAPTPGGKIAFVSYRDGNAQIYVMNADGTGQTNLSRNNFNDYDPAWSPDGKRIAFVSDRDGNDEVYVMNDDGSGVARLTRNEAADNFPAWSPDGGRIAFVSDRDGNGEIYVMNADGGGQTNLTRQSAEDGLPDWSPDGNYLCFASDRDGNGEIYVMNADGGGQANLSRTPAFDGVPVWSPDGKRIVFVSDRDGNLEIYVMNADGTGQTNLSRNNFNDYDPAWSPDGKRIAFVSDRDGNDEVYVMNADGTEQVNLTRNPAADEESAWSP